jgi:hypothetical protein
VEKFIKLTCLVLEPVAIVAEDLVTMVKDEMPGTRMLVASNADKAEEILRAHSVDIAFLNLSPVALSRTNLVETLNTMSATVVLMGHETRDIPANYRFLELPFASSTVARELRAAVQRLPWMGESVGGRGRP